MKGKYLITTNNWFVAPNGRDYKAVWGDVEILQDSILGVKTNSRSTNWYVEIGNMIVAGCQINYAIKTDKCNFKDYDHWEMFESGCVVSKTPCAIYNADKEYKG